MGCGSSQPSAPTPQAPTPQDSVNAWVSALPAIYQAQAQYAPQEAQQQVQIAQQTDLPLAQAQYQAQQALYPQTTALQENLATAANQGMNSQIPSWMKQQYQSDMNAQLGNNAASGIGADYASRGLMQQQQNWNQYYQNLGLSVAGRQPLASPQSAGYSNFMSGFTPGGVMQGQNQNYGTAANIYGTQANYQSQQNAAMMNLIGAGIGAVGSAVGAGAQGATQGAAIAASSIRYKKNVKLWIPHLN